MSSSNNRFGRRTARQNDDLRAEPQLSFNPKRPAARDGQSQPLSPAARQPIAAPRIEPEDAEEFGFGRDDGPRLERDDDFDPRVRRERALDDRVPASQRPLYQHLFDEQENRRRGFGWLAALGSVAVVAIGAGFAWHNFMARPAPANLFQPPGFTTRNNGTGYMTPTQPTTNADNGAEPGSSPSPLAATPPASGDQPPTKDIAAAPEPKSVPSEPPPPPKKTISEAAANPGSLGPPSHEATNPAPPPAPPAAKKEPAAAPAPIVTAPPKHEAAKPPAKHEAPRKEAAITPPKRAPQDTAPPPALPEPVAAPAESAPPPRARAPQTFSPQTFSPQAAGPQATGQPQPLSRGPANYAPPPQQQAPQPSFATQAPRGYFAPNNGAPGNAGPPPGTPDTVTVDGVTYVNGQEPHALGTLAAPPQDAGNPGAPPAYAPSAPPGYSTRPYTPTDHDGGAPLPNDVVILPNGQMAVPNGR